MFPDNFVRVLDADDKNPVVLRFVKKTNSSPIINLFSLN